MFVYTGRVHGRVHGPFTAVYTAVYDGHNTAVRHVHTSTPQLKGRVRAMYTASTVVYMAGRPTRPCTRAETARYGRRPCTRAMYTVVYTSHTQPSTCSSTPAVYTVAYTAVACRLGTCTRPARPTCRIHGPNGSCTRPCNGRVHGPLHGTRYVDGRKRQCTRPVHTAKNGRAHGPYTAVYASRYERYGPYTAVYTTRYTAVHSRVDGPYTAVYTDLVHVDTCTRPYTCRVHGGVHGPYMAVYTSRIRGRVRAMYTAEDSVQTACTQSCTRVV